MPTIMFHFARGSDILHERAGQSIERGPGPLESVAQFDCGQILATSLIRGSGTPLSSTEISKEVWQVSRLELSLIGTAINREEGSGGPRRWGSPWGLHRGQCIEGSFL